jgi:hypothetical protein
VASRHIVGVARLQHGATKPVSHFFPKLELNYRTIIWMSWLTQWCMLHVAEVVPGGSVGLGPKLNRLILVQPGEETGGRVREVLGAEGRGYCTSPGRQLMRISRALYRDGGRRAMPVT